MRSAVVLLIGMMLLMGCTINPQESVQDKAGGGIGTGQGTGATQNGTGSPRGNASSGTIGSSPALFTLEEVAKHNTKADCWMVIGKYVLDLSAYQNHPGGDTFVPYCGMNATEGFSTKGTVGMDHSQRAYDGIATYVIGEIGQPLPSQGAGAQAGNGTGAASGQSGGPTGGQGSGPLPPANESGSAGTQGQGSSATAVMLTMEEVARHNTASDCWMVVYGKVLNLTSFSSHPGGATYVPYCGTEATAAFDTKGGRGNPHSSSASAGISNYAIGELGAPLNRTVMASNFSNSGDDDDGFGDDEDEDEYDDD